jgi:hypothetical protein
LLFSIAGCYQTSFNLLGEGEDQKVLPLLSIIDNDIARVSAYFISKTYAVFPLDIAAPFGIILSPAVGAVLMSISTVVVSINAMLSAKNNIKDF